jgi:hypothetical protein
MMTQNNVGRRGNGALILVVLIAMAIILFLMFGGGKSSYMNQVSNTRKKGRETVNEINTGQLSILIAQYRQTSGKLPATWDEMEAPRESYTDQWGTPMTFTCDTDKRTGQTKVTYRSNGPDTEPNTADDIVRTENVPF